MTGDGICSVADWQRCFCGSSPSMYTLRNGFLQMLRYCFSDPEHYADNREALECLVYSPEGGTLQVDAVGAADPAKTDRIPGIVMSFGEGISFEMPTLSDITIEHPDNSVFAIRSIGKATLIVRCMAYEADTSCMLADMVALFLTAVKMRVLESWGGWLKDYRLARQTDPTIKQVTESDSPVTWYESSVAFSITMEYNVGTVQESKRLKVTTVRAEGHAPVEKHTNT